MEITTIDRTSGISLEQTSPMETIDSSPIAGELQLAWYPEQESVESVTDQSRESVDIFPSLIADWARPDQFDVIAEAERRYAYSQPLPLSTADRPVVFDRDMWILDSQSPTRAYSKYESEKIFNPENAGLGLFLEVVRFMLYYDDSLVRGVNSRPVILAQTNHLPLLRLLFKLFSALPWRVVLLGQSGPLEAVPEIRSIGRNNYLFTTKLTTNRGERFMEVPIFLANHLDGVFDQVERWQKESRLATTVISVIRPLATSILKYNNDMFERLRNLGPNLHMAMWQFTMPWPGRTGGKKNRGDRAMFPMGTMLKHLYDRSGSTIVTMISTPTDLRAAPTKQDARLYEQQLNYFNVEQRHKVRYILPPTYPDIKPTNFDGVSQEVITMDLARRYNIPEPEKFAQRLQEQAASLQI